MMHTKPLAMYIIAMYAYSYSNYSVASYLA